MSTLRDPDLLSALATGAASQQRELYSNGGRVVFRLKLSLIFTTVLTNVTKRPDLMDRALRLELPALDRSDRRTEAELSADWDADLPYLLADLFDHAAAALARVNAVRFMSESGLIAPPPRLADAALLADGTIRVFQISWLSKISMVRFWEKSQLRIQRCPTQLSTEVAPWWGAAVRCANAVLGQSGQLKIRGNGPPFGYYSRERVSADLLIVVIVCARSPWGIEDAFLVKCLSSRAPNHLH